MREPNNVYTALTDIDNGVFDLGMALDCLNLYIEITERDVRVLKKHGASAVGAYLESISLTQSLIHVILGRLVDSKNQIEPGIKLAFDAYLASRGNEVDA